MYTSSSHRVYLQFKCTAAVDAAAVDAAAVDADAAAAAATFNGWKITFIIFIFSLLLEHTGAPEPLWSKLQTK